MKYRDIVSRNMVYIPFNIQDKIKKVRLAFAGCGVGSNISILAARTGFNNFILVDGDKVAVSNLNRQTFIKSDLGKNKAISLSKKIKYINEKSKIKVIAKRINTKDIDTLIACSDIIINTLDYGRVFVELTDRAIKKGKSVIVPFNVGFGNVIILFNKNSSTMKDILVGSKKLGSNEDLYRHLLNSLHFKPPRYLVPKLKQIFMALDKRGFSPQLGIASYMNAAVIVTLMIRIIQNKKNIISPKYLHIDVMNIIEQNV
ncbi:MAG: ThiF family adenylyltransferase [Patescibacteria group bacterium]|nr:ThiF family adenylyltransferase [Patescibacteria group bacterium]